MAPQPLPRQSGTNEVFTSPVGGPSAASEMGSPETYGAAVKSLGDSLGQAGPDIAKALGADQAGQDLLKRDSAGQLLPLDIPWWMHLDFYHQAVADAANRALLTASINDGKASLQALARDPKYAGDATAFTTVADGLLKGGSKKLRGDARQVYLDRLTEYSGQLSNSIADDQSRRDTDKNKGALLMGVGNLHSDMLGYAFAGQETSPAYLKARTDISAQLHALEANPLFGYPPGWADDQLKHIDTESEFEAGRGTIQKVAAEHGLQAAEALARSFYYAPDRHAEMALRDSYFSRSMGDARLADATRRDGQADAQRAFAGSLDDAGVVAERTGNWHTVMSPTAIHGAFPGAAGDAIIRQLDQRAAIFTMKGTVALASPADIAALGQSIDPLHGKQAPPAAPMLDQGTAQAAIRAALPGVVFTSGTRTPKQNAAVGGAADSMHLPDAAGEGRALDFVPPGEPWTQADLNKFSAHLSANGFPHTELMIEHAGDPHSTGYHVHLGWGPKVGGEIAAQQTLFNALGDAVKARQVKIDADPAAYVSEVRPELSGQLGSTDPNAHRAAVRDLLAVQRHIGVPEDRLAIFSKPQADALVNTLLTASPDMAVQTFRNVTAGLGSDELRIVTRQVAPKNRALAAAIGAAQSDPALASNIIIGERYLAANPDAKPDDAKLAPVLDGMTAGSNGWMSNTGGLFQYAPDARAQAVAATNALYAKSIIGGKGAFDPDKWQAAFRQVVGDPITFRGQITIPPRAGMSASDLADVMNRITDKEIKQYGNSWPVDSSGRSVPADQIARNAALVYSGTPGIYRLSFPGQGVLGVLHNPNSKTFLLNLGAIAATPGAH